MATDPAGLRDDLRARLAEALGETYALERELGGGGMSRVFVALDARLGRRVVVKVLHPDLAAGLSARRFEREIALAARLQHPHIVPVHAAGEVDGLPFYTMPFVEGESLRARLQRSGALPVADAARLVRELADALAYAHAHGIIHRDLKPENVLLSGTHALVADFGVAKALASATEGAREHRPGTPALSDGTAAATGVGVVVGTPAYMAPEQAAADPATDHRADLYALGLVAYEALAGAHPFAGRPSHAMLAAQLTELPPPLAAWRGDVPPAFVALVAGLLAKRPGDRPPTAEAVVRALEGDATPAGGTTWPRGAGRGRPLRLAAAGVLAGGLVTVLVVAGALARARRARPAGAAAGEVVRPGARLVDQRVAVAPFVNQTGDSALGPLGRLTSDWIAQGLAEAGFAEVVDPETIRWTWQRAPNARALANATGARLVVTGAYYVEGDSVRLLARIGDAADDRVLRALAPVSGPVAAPRQAVARLRERVLGALGGLLDASPDAWAAASELPPSLAAYRHFSAGHEHFARDAFQDATREYLAAHRLDSTFVAPVVWAGLSRYLTGAPATADSLFRVADRARARLAPADRYLLAALWAEARGDFAGALRAAREMARVAPTSTGALLSVGWQATRVNRPAEAVAALVRLDPERPDVRRYPGYWHVLTEAYHLLGDYRAELAAAQRGRGQHPDRLTTLYNEARALSALGRIEDVGGRLDEASELAEDPGFRAVEVIEAIGGELRTHGHAAAAEAAFARALRWYDGRPAGERAAPTFRARHAEALYLAGRWEEARRIVEQLVPLPSATWHYGGYLGVMPGTPVDDVNRRGYVGVLAARRGDRAAALAADSALSALRRPYLAGRHTYWRARIAALLGDRERAVTLLQDALREGQIYSVLHGQADLASLHGFPAFEELVRPSG